MYRWFLLGTLSMLAAVNAADIRLLCGSQVTTTVARQEQDYAFEPNITIYFAQQCCTILTTTDPEASRVLLKLLRPSEAACYAVRSASGLLFFDGWLTFTKYGLCNLPSDRCTMAGNNARVCLGIYNVDSMPDGTLRPFAFSAVSALHVCESSVWHRRASIALDVGPTYVFAPDRRTALPLRNLNEITECAPGEDFIRVVIAGNVDSSSLMQVEVLTVPDAISCRSLFMQNQMVREGDSFAISAGNQLTISYNMSRNSTCDARNSSLIGFVVRLSDSSKDSYSTSIASVHWWTDDRSSENHWFLLLCLRFGIFVAMRAQ